jgi:hypothetical protein
VSTSRRRLAAKPQFRTAAAAVGHATHSSADTRAVTAVARPLGEASRVRAATAIGALGCRRAPAFRSGRTGSGRRCCWCYRWKAAPPGDHPSDSDRHLTPERGRDREQLARPSETQVIEPRSDMAPQTTNPAAHGVRTAARIRHLPSSWTSRSCHVPASGPVTVAGTLASVGGRFSWSFGGAERGGVMPDLRYGPAG